LRVPIRFISVDDVDGDSVRAPNARDSSATVAHTGFTRRLLSTVAVSHCNEDGASRSWYELGHADLGRRGCVPHVIKDILFRAAERAKVLTTLVSNMPLSARIVTVHQDHPGGEGFDVADQRIAQELQPATW